jgi:hypothetical protein
MLKAAAEAIVGTRAIVQKGSLNIKNEARKNVAQSAPIHNAHAANAITYDTEIDAKGLVTRGEIGYDKAVPVARWATCWSTAPATTPRTATSAARSTRNCRASRTPSR